MSQYMHQDAKLWQIVKIGRSKYQAIGRMPDGLMLWKGSGPTIYTLIEKAAGEWGTGRFDDAPFAQPIAQQFSRLSEKIRKYIREQQKRGSAITPAGIWRNPPVRKNVFLFNNPGNAQKILAENFVKGANSGVASSMYIHGKRIYSYGPHFPIAQRNDDGTILIRHPSKKAPSKTTAGHISLVVNAARQVFAPDSILYDTAGELSAEAKGPAAFSNPGVRRNSNFLFKNPKEKVRENIFLFNNPRELNTVESAAAAVGLVVGTWAPGDGVTRYRFFLSDGKSRYGDYHQGDGLYTALGRKDAMAFVSAYGKGRSARTNPKSAPVYVIEGFTHHGRRGHSQRRAEFRTPSLGEARARAEQIFKETGVVVAITQRNPLTHAETVELEHTARRERIMGEQIQGPGSRGYALGHSDGLRHVVKKYGTYPRRNPSVRCNPASCLNPSHPHGALENPYGRGRERRSYQEFLSRKQAEYGAKFDASDLDPRFISYYENGKRIWVNDFGHVTSGTVGVTTGWKPVFLLISSSRAMGSSTTLTTKTKVLGEVGIYKPRRGEYGQAIENVRPNPLLQTIMLANPGSVKTFNEMQDVGKAKYVVNYHDGVKVHRDGSPFFDIAIFSSRAKKDQFVRKLESLGFTRGALRNPPISQQWDRLTGRQRLQILGFVGFDETASRYVRLPWNLLSSMVKQALEQYWSDSSSSRGTTRRRMAPVGVNPLTRKEAGRIIGDARRSIRHGETFAPGHTRSVMAGKAFGKSQVVSVFGPKSARPAARKITERAQRMAKAVISNPSVRLPKPGTKMTVAQALDLARRIGDRGLIEQCQKALKLQKVANKNAKTVIWKTFPMGSSDKIDSVVALTHYGDSPETMYQPPKGSKKGNHMYRHKWGETGGKRSVPLLASADGKMLLMPLEGKKVASDWLRH